MARKARLFSVFRDSSGKAQHSKAQSIAAQHTLLSLLHLCCNSTEPQGLHMRGHLAEIGASAHSIMCASYTPLLQLVLQRTQKMRGQLLMDKSSRRTYSTDSSSRSWVFL